jgi:hypothetical protein
VAVDAPRTGCWCRPYHTRLRDTPRRPRATRVVRVWLRWPCSVSVSLRQREHLLLLAVLGFHSAVARPVGTPFSWDNMQTSNGQGSQRIILKVITTSNADLTCTCTPYGFELFQNKEPLLVTTKLFAEIDPTKCRLRKSGNIAHLHLQVRWVCG